MLNHPTLDKLVALKLTGMAKAFSEQMDLPESQTLSFEERLGRLRYPGADFTDAAREQLFVGHQAARLDRV